MKLKHFYIFSLILSAIIFISCDDTLQPLGYSIQPGGDRISLGNDTLALQANTVAIDSIFAKTKTPLLGEYEDKFFGKISSDYTGELFIPENFAFPKGSVIDDVDVSIYYNSWVGDSLQPIRIAVHEIVKKLPDSNFYTNVDFSSYYNPTPLTEEYFTAGSTSHIFKLPVDKSVGERFLKNPDKLVSTEVFKEFFKGLYVTSTFGKGNLVNIGYTYLNTKYHYPGVSSTTKKDTVFTKVLSLVMTPEVTQLNHVETDNTSLLQPNSEYAFLKSPAGVATELIIPLTKFSEKLKSQALNAANLRVSVDPSINKDQKFKLTIPAHVLLIPKGEMKTFFEKRRLPNDSTVFIGKFNYTSFNYVFNGGNLAQMINYYLKKFEKENGGQIKDLDYLILPVSATFTSDGKTVTSVSNLMAPAAAAIRKDPQHLKMEMVFSKF